MKKLNLDSSKEWTFEQIDDIYQVLSEIATSDKYKLDFYPNQIEIISSEQMLESYCTVGMPTYYSHWSFGKQYVQESEAYKRGHMGLAYEIVINSSPCISYLMEENSVAMQCLVIAHAAFGHNSFFKNNVHFKQWTDASSIIDYLSYAKKYIADCEERYGAKEVESILDAAHAIRNHGIDRYKRPPALSKQQLVDKEKERIKHAESTFDDIWRTLPGQAKSKTKTEEKFPAEPEENLLYFIEQHAPNMPQWKREIISIVRKIAQYFYPQMLTQIMNEGWATYTHYTLLNELYDQGHVTDGFMLEWLQSHSGVIFQRPLKPINPYALGLAMYQDIERICTNPTKEDIEWFPEWAGNQKVRETLEFAAYNFKDESFIMQFLSPKVIRDFKLFHILDDDHNPKIQVEAIQNADGYRKVREKLSEQQNVNNRIPYIQVVDVDVWGDRTLYLEHSTHHRHCLHYEDTMKTLQHIATLWGYAVSLKSINRDDGSKLDEFMFDPTEDDTY